MTYNFQALQFIAMIIGGFFLLKWLYQLVAKIMGEILGAFVQRQIRETREWLQSIANLTYSREREMADFERRIKIIEEKAHDRIRKSR